MAGSAILDSRGNPMVVDSVTSAIQSAGVGFGYGALQQQNSPSIGAALFAPQLAIAAYLASGLLQKVINIPAQDRVREWREWQAESDVVTAIEDEEKRLGLIRKVRQAEVLRGLGGGALILCFNQRAGTIASMPVSPLLLRPGALVAVNVVSRHEITPTDFDNDLTSPRYGEPNAYQIGAGQKIHWSRVIAFRGDPLPAIAGVGEVDRFWGQSRLVKVWQEVERSDRTQEWFAALVKKAKLLRIGIPGLTDFTATEGGQARLDRRMQAIALGESILNATVTDAGGKDTAGETISDFQMTWTGIPAVMDAFDQRVAAVSDIPFTRLMGRSPAGMNSTGEHDAANWAASVAAGQELDLRPCLEQLDLFLFASAGVSADGIWWKFASIYKPSAKEEADRFKTYTEGFKNLADVNAMPSPAFAAGVQSVIEANGFMPGATPLLAKMDEAERFGITPDDDGTDPSAITEGGDPDLGTGGRDGSAARRLAANDKVTSSEGE